MIFSKARGEIDTMWWKLLRAYVAYSGTEASVDAAAADVAPLESRQLLTLGIQPVLLGATGLDDTSSGRVTLTGPWSQYGDPLQPQIAFIATGPGSGAAATYRFENMPNGRYIVEASWTANELYASDARFSFRTAGGQTLQADRLVDQRVAPTDRTVAGAGWEQIDFFDHPGGTAIDVRITAGLTGTTVANGVRLVPVTRDFQFVDDGDRFFATTGVWNTGTSLDGDGMSSSTPGSTARWYFTSLTAGVYRIGMRYEQRPGNDPAAVFRVYNSASGALLASKSVDQTTPATGYVPRSTNNYEQLLLSELTLPDGVGGIYVEVVCTGATVLADQVRLDRVVENRTHRIVDNEGPGFSVTGAWGAVNGLTGHASWNRYGLNGLVTATVGAAATWTFTGLVPGTYQVSVPGGAQVYAAWSRYTYQESTGGPALTTTSTPLGERDYYADDHLWRSGPNRVTITGSTLIVSITHTAGIAGHTLADAMRIDRVDVGPIQIVDDGSPAYTGGGTGTVLAGVGFEGDSRTINQPATWSFYDLRPGRYRVAATWAPSPGLSTAATYTVIDPANGGATLGTATVDQRTQLPTSFAAAGVPWHLLGEFTLTEDVLDVRLSSAAGVALADAIRVERVQEAVEFIDNSDPTFGIGGLWGLVTSVNRFQRILGEGVAGDYVVGENATWRINGLSPGFYRLGRRVTPNFDPSSFFRVYDASSGALLLDYQAQSLYAKNSTTISDGGFDWFTSQGFPVSGSELLVVGSFAGFIDALRLERVSDVVTFVRADDPVRVTETGSWGFGGPFGGEPPGLSSWLTTTGSDSVEYRFTDLRRGRYRVQVQWNSASFLTMNPVARYTIRDGVNGTVVGATTRNQANSPSDVTLPGLGGFADLGAFDVTSGTLALTIDPFGQTGPTTSAGAVRIVPEHTIQYIDDIDAGFGNAPGWGAAAGQGAGRNNGFHWVAHNNSPLTYADWIARDLTPGQYRVSATWLNGATLATNAVYAIVDGVNGPIRSLTTVNQRNLPASFIEAGSRWQDLGTVAITGSELLVRLSNIGNGPLIADAIRIERIDNFPTEPDSSIGSAAIAQSSAPVSSSSDATSFVSAVPSSARRASGRRRRRNASAEPQGSPDVGAN